MEHCTATCCPERPVNTKLKFDEVTFSKKSAKKRLSSIYFVSPLGRCFVSRGKCFSLGG